jgi:hypothetical protein
MRVVRLLFLNSPVAACRARPVNLIRWRGGLAVRRDPAAQRVTSPCIPNIRLLIVNEDKDP